MAGTITHDSREVISRLYNAFAGENAQPHPGTLRIIREEAFNRFMKTGIPERKNEDYKYFPVYRHFPEKPVIGNDGVGTIDESLIDRLKIKDEKAIHLFFLNGRLSVPFSTKDISGKGMEFLPLAQNSDDALKPYIELLKATQNINNDGFIDLNTAFLDKGFILNITSKAGHIPIYCYYINKDTRAGQLVNYRYLINLEADSSATLTEINYSESGENYFENQLTEIHINHGSKLNYYKVQQTGKNSVHINNTNIYQAANSLSNLYTFSINDHMIRNNLNILLNEEHSESHLYGLYYVNNNNLFDNHTTVDHRVANCFSNELYKGIMDDNGKGVFNGKIYVRPNAQKTNAFQSNKNIVLTDSASINTKPQLEIWADDVKCSHGATTGQIDKEQMFYLRSRGLDKKTARALLLHAFAFEIIDKIDMEPLREYLAVLVNDKLGYQFSD